MTEIKRDAYGIVGQPDGRYMFSIEGGDSMSWTAHWLYLHKETIGEAESKWYDDTFQSKTHFGLYVRHPNTYQSIFGWASYCEGNWRGVESRDQMTGKLCFFAKANATASLWRSFKRHCKRFMLFANNSIHNGQDPKTSKRKLPDFTGPDIWALYIRGFRLKILYPLLILFDLHLLVDAILLKLSSDNDIISHVLKVITAREIMPTPISWLASKIPTTENIREKLYKYWTGWRKQDGMYELYIPYVNKYWR